MTHFLRLATLAAAALLLGACQTALDKVNGLLLPDLHADMTVEDTRLAASALQQALESRPAGNGVRWENPETGFAGTFTPERTLQIETGHFCRDFTENLKTSDGRRASYRLTACRDGQGAWVVR